MNEKNITIAVAVLVIGGIAGGYFFPLAGLQPSSLAGTISTASTTFSTAKVAMAEWSPATMGATTTGNLLYNGDATDRIIEATAIDCNTVGASLTISTGTKLRSLIFTAGTTTNPNGLALANNNIYNSDIATSSPDFYDASTTPGTTGTAWKRIWNAGTYLLFASNATNTANCLAGVHYLAS